MIFEWATLHLKYAGMHYIAGRYVGLVLVKIPSVETHSKVEMAPYRDSKIS